VNRKDFWLLVRSRKEETARLCDEAEQHDFCPRCGVLLCNGELCDPNSLGPDSKRKGA